MKIDFKKEVLKRKDEIIKNTQALLKINSELAEYDPKSTTPFGKGINDALHFMLDMAKKDGFETLNANNYAGHIEMGEGEEFVGMIGHLDVVPAGSNWDYPPYGAEIHDGKIYARGAEDDKGPTMAAYYAMKILLDLDIPLKRRIKLILGTDEETAWRGVNYYFKHFPEQPIYGFIPDADFPLTYSEKGIMSVTVRGKVKPHGLTLFKSGLVSNMVPDACLVRLDDVSLKQAFDAYIKAHEIVGESTIEDGSLYLKVSGKSAHGSMPHLGKNAAYLMIDFFNHVGFANDFIDLINLYLHNDLEGRKMGIDHVDEETGSVTVNAGVFDYENGTYKIVINPRYPNGVDPEQFMKKMLACLGSKGAKVTLDKHQEKLYVDPNDTLVQTLLNVYIRNTGDKDAKPMTTGGGTFARAMENSVAFGPHFPNKPSYIHQKNEYIEVDDLLLSIAIYAEALYELATK